MSELAFNPWVVWEAEFPSNALPPRQRIILLNYAVLAPSNHNAQPWLFQVEEVRIPECGEVICFTLENFSEKWRAVCH